jgi:hypothetical protein
MNDTTKISNDNIVLHDGYGLLTNALSGDNMSVLEESATWEAEISFMPRSMVCRKNLLVFVSNTHPLQVYAVWGIHVCGLEYVVMKIYGYFIYTIRMESSRFSVNSWI